MKKYALTSAAALFSLIVSFCAGYFTGFDASRVTGPNMVEKVSAAEPEQEMLEEAVPVAAQEESRIGPLTTMVYEYYYTQDGAVERSTEAPPYFIMDMTKDELQNTYSDWLVMEFSPEEVVLRKTVEGRSSQHYIIGVEGGYIAVFYADENGESSIKEITDMPVNDLPWEEQEKLKIGVQVHGDEELIRAMEDYGS